MCPMQSHCALLRARGRALRELVRGAIRRLAGGWLTAGGVPHNLPLVLDEAAAILLTRADYILAAECARLLASPAQAHAMALFGQIEIRRGVTVAARVAAGTDAASTIRDMVVLQIMDNSGDLRDIMAVALASDNEATAAFDRALPGVRDILISGGASPTYDPVRLCMLASDKIPLDVTDTPALLVASLCLLGDAQLLRFCCHVLGGDVSPYVAPVPPAADTTAGRRKIRPYRLAVLHRRHPSHSEIYITDILRHLSRHAVACGRTGCIGDPDFCALVYAFAYFAVVARSPQRRPTAIYGDIWAAVDHFAGRCLSGSLPTPLADSESSDDPSEVLTYFAAMDAAPEFSGKRRRPTRSTSCSPTTSDDDNGGDCEA